MDFKDQYGNILKGALGDVKNLTGTLDKYQNEVGKMLSNIHEQVPEHDRKKFGEVLESQLSEMNNVTGKAADAAENLRKKFS